MLNNSIMITCYLYIKWNESIQRKIDLHFILMLTIKFAFLERKKISNLSCFFLFVLIVVRLIKYHLFRHFPAHILNSVKFEQKHEMNRMNSLAFESHNHVHTGEIQFFFVYEQDYQICQ